MDQVNRESLTGIVAVQFPSLPGNLSGILPFDTANFPDADFWAPCQTNKDKSCVDRRILDDWDYAFLDFFLAGQGAADAPRLGWPRRSESFLPFHLPSVCVDNS
jgi:hypothetical protein